MNEDKLKELEKETQDKKGVYLSLLKQNQPLYKNYCIDNNSASIFIGGVIFAIISLFIDLFPLGAIIAIITGIVSYKCYNRFELTFKDLASDELKNARQEYEDYKQRLKEAEKAIKEEQIAQRREELQQSLDELRSINDEEDDDDDDDDPETRGKMYEKMLATIYGPEIEYISNHVVYVSDLSDTIGKNTLVVQTYIGKAIIITGEIAKIDYDKEKKMPYIIMGSRKYRSSGMCDEYTSYFSDPKQLDIIKTLEVGKRIVLCGIFSESRHDLPTKYLLSQCYVLYL